MKKCFAIILAAAMLLCAAPLAGFTAINWPKMNFGNLFPVAQAATIVDSDNCGAEGDGSNLTWTLDDEGTLTVSGTGKMAANAFPNKKNIKKVIIENGVTSIGNYVFRDCTNLMSITIPASVTSIGLCAFEGCAKLTSVTIENGVTSIDNFAFSDCTDLTSITIPDSVTSIGGYVFRDCTNLTSITIPDSVTEIGSDVFSGTAWYDNQPDGLVYAGRVAYVYKGDMPDNTAVVLKDGTKVIRDHAFDGCMGLTGVTIPASVTSIGNFAFYGCTGLSQISVAEDNPVYRSAGNCLIKKNTKTLVFGCKNSVIPADGSVTSIGYDAFSDCTGLTSITIPDGVTSIDDFAFDGCMALTGVTIADSVTSVGKYAFSDTAWYDKQPDGLVYAGKVAYKYKGAMPDNTVVVLKAGTTGIATQAFEGCTGMTGITIPDSVTNIGYDAFSGCSGLTNITIPNGVTSILGSAFSGCTGLSQISVAEDNPVYRSAGNCLIETNTKTLMSGCKNSAIPADGSVTSIGDYAFWFCSGLTDMTIPASVMSIGAGAFWGCTGLTGITIPNSVTSIGISAFCYCAGLTGITIPNGVTSIGAWVFDGCEGLTKITIPNSVTSIGREAFTGCNELKDVYFIGSEQEWDIIDIGERNTCLTDANVHFIDPPINSDTARESDGNIHTISGMTATELTALAGDGATITKADGTKLTEKELVGSGMILTKPNDEKLTIVIKGDNDGDGKISSADARLALRRSVALEEFTDWQTAASLVGENDKVTSGDARLILRASVGLETLPLV